MSQLARLHHFPLSPFCRKVRLALAEKRQKFEEVIERYWEPSAEFLMLNPAGKVPVLKIEGSVLAESTAICEYLEELWPDPPLLPEGPLDRAEARRLVGWFDDKFYREVTVNLLGERLLKKVAGGRAPESDKVMLGIRNCRFHIDYMAGLLDRRRWLAGNAMSLADIAAAAQLSCLDYVSDVDWDRSESLRIWYSAIKSRPSFRPLLSDHLPGFPPPPHYADLDF
ncbi:MAG: glutathione S-transferase family protein [Paracoccaceae bacterium]|nr:glutathione S-transferase family protein [Paracoccaceae bacterium]